VLAGSYVLYGSLAVVYTQMLARERRIVTDAMVPEWWKFLAVAIGIWFVAASLRLLRSWRPPARKASS
jgi:hypothetical protein